MTFLRMIVRGIIFPSGVAGPDIYCECEQLILPEVVLLLKRKLHILHTCADSFTYCVDGR